MIKSISIRHFRIFKDIDINLGKRITIISGRNATGKSNLLAMLGNSCQLNTRKEKSILGKEFRTEFGEIFKGSINFDKTGSGMYKVIFDKLDSSMNPIYREFRVTWQDDNTRFRVIPKYEWVLNGTKKKTEKKYNTPSLYLGLSRLYPIGESKDKSIRTSNLKVTTEESEELNTLYNRIMEPESMVSLDYLEVSEKNSVGFSTNTYDFNSNSAGQDNIMQILLAILSFKRLKLSLDTDYSGGLLLIDEIDSTLHPKAQLELINVLDQYSRELDLQIVATSHSEKILKIISSKLGEQRLSEQEDYKVVYLTKSNGFLECKEENLTAMINDLNSTSGIYKNNKLTVYSEDDEARWFLTKLTYKLLPSMQLIQTKLGHDQLLLLDHHDRKYFSNVLFVFDGDVPQEKLKTYHNGTGNKLTLPYKNNPEKVIYNYINSLPKGHRLLVILWDDYSTSKELILSDCKDINNRYESKAWFNRHLHIFDQIDIVDYLIEDNPEEYNVFKKNFINKYNGLATKLFLNRINKH